MLHADLADTSLASEWPDVAGQVDTLADLLRETLAAFIPSDRQARAFTALEQTLHDSGHLVSTVDREQIASGILFAVYGDTSLEPEIRLIAAAALKRIGKDGRSYQAIGDEFGKTRACVHAHSRRIERRTGLKCRSDKDAEARQKSTASATGRRRSGAATSATLRGGKGRWRSLFSVFKLRGV